VRESEAGDEERLDEVEITLDAGAEIDVQRHGQFDVVGSRLDHEEASTRNDGAGDCERARTERPISRCCTGPGSSLRRRANDARRWRAAAVWASCIRARASSVWKYGCTVSPFEAIVRAGGVAHVLRGP
jgi:hypothetical protein